MCALFSEGGFDAVTVKEAAREVGISRATFFRYFGSKEDVVLAALEGSSVDFGSILANLSPIEGENAWQLLHRTFRQGLAHIDDNPEQERARLRMVHTTPSLRARLTDRRLIHEDSLTAALSERIDPPEASRPVVLAGLAVLERGWASDDEPSLRKALDEAFPGLNAAGEPARGISGYHTWSAFMNKWQRFSAGNTRVPPPWKRHGYRERSAP